MADTKTADLWEHDMPCGDNDLARKSRVKYIDLILAQGRREGELGICRCNCHVPEDQRVMETEEHENCDECMNAMCDEIDSDARRAGRLKGARATFRHIDAAILKKAYSDNCIPKFPTYIGIAEEIRLGRFGNPAAVVAGMDKT